MNVINFEFKYILTFVFSSAISLAFTPAMIRLASKLGIVDHPEAGKWHRDAVPSIGGVVIFFGFMLVSIIFAPAGRDMLIILSGAGIIFALGLLDDRFGIYPLTKFIVQLAVALVLVMLGIRAKILPPILAIPMTLIWIVGITNALNLLDNMDGLASGVAFIASVTIFIFTRQVGMMAVPIMSLALAGVCLGFLRYNFSPARIFMGDCGSLLLGYVLSTLAIMAFWQRSSPIFPNLFIPILILGYPIFDTVMVTVLRLKSGGMPWVGGQDHSSHRMVRMGLGERSAVLIIYALGIMCSISAFALLNTDMSVGIFLIAFLLLFALAFGWFLANRGRELPVIEKDHIDESGNMMSESFFEE